MIKYLSAAVFAISGLVLTTWFFTSLVIVWQNYDFVRHFPTRVSDWAEAFVQVPYEFGLEPSFYTFFGPFISFYAIVATLIASVRHG